MVTGTVACHILGLVVPVVRAAPVVRAVPENREFLVAPESPVDQESQESRAVLPCHPCRPCLTVPADLSDPSHRDYPEAREGPSFPARQWLLVSPSRLAAPERL